MITKKAAAKLKKEFHKFWLENGEPDPSSNAYLAMVQAFYWSKGYVAGIEAHTKYGR